MKKSLYAIAGLSLITLNQANAINTNTVPIDPNLTTQGTADQVVQGWIINAMGLLSLAAIIYGLWGGFNILTAGGDEEKVKTGKTIIINSLIGIVVIFLVGTIVRLLINVILKST